MKIKHLDISASKRPLIVAELGTLHHAKGKAGVMRATEQAIDAGADMVKIQCIDPKLATEWASAKQMARYLTLYRKFGHLAWRDYFFEANQRFKQPIFASCFDSATVHWLRDAVPCYKIAQRCSNWLGLVESIESTHHPFMVSLSNEVPPIWENKSNKSLYLHVIPYQYPLDPCAFRIEQPDFYQGLSLHTNRLSLIQSFCNNYHSKVVELHLQGTYADGPDTSFALTMVELKKLRAML